MKIHTNNVGFFLIISIIILIIWIVNWTLPQCSFLLNLIGAPHTGISGPGEFGDMFGASNSLFSGFAFVALIFTIRQQSKEINLQKEELKLTRTTLDEQKLAMEAQAQSLHIQQFENTFFQILATVQKKIDSLKVSISRQHPLTGHEVLHRNLEAFKLNKHPSYNENFKKTFNQELSFLQLIEIAIDFIHNSNESKKKFYINIIKCSLTADELRILFLYSLSNSTATNFKEIDEKYSFFEHLFFEPNCPLEAYREKHKKQHTR